MVLENGVSIGWILGTALTVFLMDYFKLFSEEGKKIRNLYGN